jgi:ABC-type uncharacterized transport system substrate-binding protein
MTLMHRRSFLTLLGSAAAAWPLAARAQQRTMPVVGFLSMNSERVVASYLTALRAGLSEAGFVEGRNVRTEFRGTDDSLMGKLRRGELTPAEGSGRLAEAAAELVQLQPTVIVPLEGGPIIRAARAATSTIPIVFFFAGDPIKFGFVASLSRPGGNMTGVSSLSTELMGKRLDLLHKLAPQVTTFAFLTDSRAPFAEELASDVQAASNLLGKQIVIADASGGGVEAAFAMMLRQGAGAVLVGPYTLFDINSQNVLRLTARHRLPACYAGRGWCQRGGLMSYTPDPGPLRKIIIEYVVRILKGEKPADLPVQQPTKFEFVINLQTALTLGIEVPPMLLALADEVIQ